MNTQTLIAQTPTQPAPPEPMAVEGGVIIAAVLTILGAVGGFIAKDVLPKAANYIQNKEDAEAELIKSKEETQNRITERLMDQVFNADKQNLNRIVEAMHSDNARLHDAIIALSESVKLQTKTIEVSVQGTMAGQAGLYAEHSERLGNVSKSLEALHTRLDAVLELQKTSTEKLNQLIQILQTAIGKKQPSKSTQVDSPRK